MNIRYGSSIQLLCTIKKSYFYVKLSLWRTLDFFMLFDTGITSGVHCATFTFGRSPGASNDLTGGEKKIL